MLNLIIFVFLSGFSSTNFHDSQDCRGRGGYFFNFLCFMIVLNSILHCNLQRHLIHLKKKVFCGCKRQIYIVIISKKSVSNNVHDKVYCYIPLFFSKYISNLSIYFIILFNLSIRHFSLQKTFNLVESLAKSQDEYSQEYQVLKE